MDTIVAATSSGKLLSAGYVAGGIIALLMLGYLIYVLIRPEKF
ncbi:MAG: K(+)-transporting ATPase subunit F [Bacteroidota bacterium]|nr:K(+)-transporting ATPase subunit F [Bacteroidota bacterium]